MHNLKPATGARTKPKRVGRGNASGKGTTAGRGTKGQRARSGGKRGLAHLGRKRVLLRIPKVRGFKSHGSRLQTITLDDLERWFPAGAKVTVEGLKSASRIPARAGGAKVVQTGTLTKALTLVDIATTPGAKIVIEKLGGTIGEIRKSKKGKKATASKKAVR